MADSAASSIPHAVDVDGETIVSFIVPVRNDAVRLRRCLTTIRANTPASARVPDGHFTFSWLALKPSSCWAFAAVSADVALGTLPSRDSLMSEPIRVLVLTLLDRTAFRRISDAPTPFFLIWARPTLLRGRLTIA